MKRNLVVALALAIIVPFSIAGCSSGGQTASEQAQKQAQTNSSDRQNFVPKNDIEGKNYNARQKLADDPNTIVWCSVYPTNPNVKPFTVPIVGKLTSSNKRPAPTSIVDYQAKYYPELPGQDGMYGSSSSYRFGFDPAGNYWDFSETLEGVCSSVPTVIQKATTQFAITASGDVNALSTKANAALKKCNNNDPSKPCAAAAQILGIEGK